VSGPAPTWKSFEGDAELVAHHGKPDTICNGLLIVEKHSLEFLYSVD
jgi:hypothetical protein